MAGGRLQIQRRRCGFPVLAVVQVWLATSIASLYGISDEFHQSFVPGRTPDVVDWLADTSGALLAVLLIAHFSRSFNKARRLG